MAPQPSQEGDPGEKSSWRDACHRYYNVNTHTSFNGYVCFCTAFSTKSGLVLRKTITKGQIRDNQCSVAKVAMLFHERHFTTFFYFIFYFNAVDYHRKSF